MKVQNLPISMSVCFTLITISLHAVLGTQSFYPPIINPAKGKPVVLYPEDAICGLQGEEVICESRTDAVTDCNTWKSKCNSNCPYRKIPPVKVDTFGTVSSWSTNCLEKQYSDLAPNAYASSGYKVELKDDPTKGECFLMLSPTGMLSITLSEKLSLSLTMWIKPLSNSNSKGTLLDIADKDENSLLHIYVDDQNQVKIQSELLIQGSSWTVDNDVWQHIALQMYNNTVSFFINGAFRWPAYSKDGAIKGHRSAVRYKIGDSFQGGDRFKGYIQDFHIYLESLTNREIREVYSGTLQSVQPQSECRCPSSAPKVKQDDPTYCTSNLENSGVLMYRLNPNGHPAEFVVDEKTDTKWISAKGMDETSLAIDLTDVFEIRKISLHFYSPFPDAVIISRRINSSTSWTYWQLFSHDCLTQTGFQENQSISHESDIICKPYIESGEIMLYSQGKLTFDLLQDRPGQSSEQGMSLALGEFLQASAINITLRGHPYVTQDMQKYHSLIEVEVEGYCNCHGHGVQCLVTSDKPYKCTCATDSLTEGRQCDQCVSGNYMDPAKHAYHADMCQSCQCADAGTQGDVTQCDAVGGQCMCKTHVTGRACDTCKDGYYDLRTADSDGCKPCACNTGGTTGATDTCDKQTGVCPCKANVQGRTCGECKPTFYAFTSSNDNGCQTCGCDTAGTQNREQSCDVVTGQCMCKDNVQGLTCSECKDEYFLLSDTSSVGCQDCYCNSNGAENNICNKTTGQCLCKFNVTGLKCDQCTMGMYAPNASLLSQRGCTEACDCDPDGTKGGTDGGCEKLGGQCPCKESVEGRQCNRCKPNAYGFGSSDLKNDEGCHLCDCDLYGTDSSTSACDQITGQCTCKPYVTGRRCNACEQGHYGLDLGCLGCDCYVRGSVEGVTCNATSGQCPCRPGHGNITRAGRTCNAYEESMSPVQGPAAGGTKVLIKGGFFGDITDTTKVHIGNDQQCNVSYTASSPTALVCYTTPMTDATLEEPQEVLIHFSYGDEMILIHYAFRYLPDPIITKVEPLVTILSGGLTLTVSGENLDSVETPYLLVWAMWIDANKTMQMEMFSNICTDVESKKMKCLTPTITIVEGPGYMDVTYNIGFRLDGVTEYLNLNSSLPEYSTITVYHDPEILEFEEDIKTYRPYWPYDDTHINIKGRKLNLGAVSEDYSVFIGTDLCDGVEVTEQDIVCLPNETQPESPTDSAYPEVIVTVGNKKVIVGQLRYEMSFWDNDPFRYGVFGGVGGLVLVIILLILCCCCCCRKSKEVERNRGGLETGILTNSSKGSNDYTDQKYNISSAYMNPAMDLSLLELLPTKLKDSLSDCMIERKRVTMGTIIGQGQYGEVYLGRLLDKTSGTQQTPVAIKTMKEDCSTKQEALEFLQEATLMKEFKHDNLLSLVGVVIEHNSVLVLLPFMENGDLRTFISNDGNMLTVGELINFGQQVCSGMAFLSEKHFIHRDLACRNCMINKDLVVKVGDFGLSRDIYEDDYYEVGETRRKLPIKWMAPESLERGIFSAKTDVWAFGVLEWELLTRGCVPYPDVDAFDIKFYLRQGNRMDRPDFAPEEMYQLMLLCWDAEPRNRPSFYEIQQQIATFLEMQNARTNLRKRQKQQVPTRHSYIMQAE